MPNPTSQPTNGPTTSFKSTHPVDQIFAKIFVRCAHLLSRLPLKLPPPSVMFGLLALVAAFAIGRYTSHRAEPASEVADEEAAPRTQARSGVPFPIPAASGARSVATAADESLPELPATPPRPRPIAVPKGAPSPARPRPAPMQATPAPSTAIPAAAPPPAVLIPDGCMGGAPTSTLKTLSLPADHYAAGMPIVFKNTMSRPAYVEVFDPQTGERSGTAVILAGGSIAMPVVGDSALANISVGTQWCTPDIGWVDPKVTRIRPALVAANGSIRMDVALQSSSSSGWPVTLKVDHVMPKRLMLQPSESEVAYASMPNEPRYIPSIIPGVTPNFKAALRQNDTIAGVGRTYATPMHFGDDSQERNRLLPNMDYVGMPSSEWKLSRNGALDYVPGQIGSTDIQFVVDLRSPMSAIPTSLARQLGIIDCTNGHWFISGLYRKACAAKIASLTVGGTELHNVWITYGTDIARPTLGRNVLGSARYKRGTDGTYLTVGQS